MAIEWFYKSDGQEHGPVNASEIRRLAEAGIITPTTPVRKAEMKNWIMASALKGLFPALPTETPKTIQPAVQSVAPPPVPTTEALVPAPSEAIPTKRKQPFTARVVVGIIAFVIAYAISNYVFRNLGSWVGGKAGGMGLSTPGATGGVNDVIDAAMQSNDVRTRNNVLYTLRIHDANQPRERERGLLLARQTISDVRFSAAFPAAVEALAACGSKEDAPSIQSVLNRTEPQLHQLAIAALLQLDPPTGLHELEGAASQQPSLPDDVEQEIRGVGSPHERDAALTMLNSSNVEIRRAALSMIQDSGNAKDIPLVQAAQDKETASNMTYRYAEVIKSLARRSG